ncbi:MULTISPECIES: flagellar basal body rod protein FlgC [Paracoccus]|jgi:flagellar basal-body rod protein FlgC|uniref:Flagellar basal body rod protein FlgC n=1 Tax=Paracoccus aerius TaxID=1915382 RepID=A0ABS1S527_9RHOB|nr:MULTISPECIES: flagellar basal body rod protein FlgC [Paracoccus]MBL3672656.1 flagellar basal body rod protein FlgC [Paracoccus aerius]QIR84016.1 flagellar basal body rod protein FlgC [Paracoccus sp. AK26]GHG14555.1 flagellar basal body rod protein FlgC [Paracoccus aerius]
MDRPVSALHLAASGMRAQSERLRHTAENIANADTPGYRRKLVTFEEAVRFGRPSGEVEASKVRLDQGELPRLYDPSHPLADEDGYYLGSNVDLVIEIADSREAGRSYEANLKMFEQTRQMGASLLELLRR